MRYSPFSGSINPFKVKFLTSRQTNNDLLITNSPEDIKCAPVINSLALKQIIIYHNMYPDSGLKSQSHSLEKQVSTSVLK